MSIMEAFRSALGVGGAQNPTPAIGANGAPVNPNVDPSKNNPSVPGASSSAGNNGSGAAPAAFPVVEAEGEKSPLDGFAKLWEIDPKQTGPKSLVPSINADPKAIMDASRKLDFTKALSEATLAGIAKSDPKAFLAGINEASQAAFAQAAGMTSNLLTQALTAQEKTFREDVMPDILRKHNVSNALRTDNPLFDNPAVKPVLTMVENQFSSKHPGASPQEITTLAKQYLSEFATEILGNAGKVVSDAPKQDTRQRGTTDWGKFFDA